MADVPSESKAQTVRPSDISVPPNTPQSGVPISVYSPDEKYEDTVKSFYNWLEQHECRSQDKPKRGGLVADKIAQFGDKLESHLSTRTGTDMPRKSTVGTPKHYPMPKSSATRKISQEEFLDENGDPVMSGISDAKRQNNPGNTRNLSRAAVLVEPSDMGVYKGPVPPPPPMMDAPRMTSASRAPAESKPRAENVSPGRRMASGPTPPAEAKIPDSPSMASGAGNRTGQQPRHVASGVPAGTRGNVVASKAEIPKPSDPTVVKVASPALKGSAVSQHSPSPIGSSKAATIEQDLPKSVEIRVPKSSSSQRNIVEHEPLFNNVLDIPCRPKAPLDFPPPPPSLLETDLDQLPTGDQQPKTHQELTDDSIGKSAKQSPVKDEEIVKVEPMKVSNWVEGEANGMGKFSKTGQQDVLQDSRTVLHSNLPARGQFTARIDNPDRDVQGVLVREVDEGQPCLACEKCQGFEPHHWRKTCNSCKCPRESHDVFHEEWVNVRERLGIGQDQDKWNSRDSLSQGLSWAPPGLPPYKVDQYFKCLPQDKVPKLGTSGEKHREKQLMIQLPKQDLALAYCRHVDPAHHTSYDDFITARNEIALDIAYAKECTLKTDCPECGRSVNQGDVGVLAPKFGEKILWHPSCFICCQCKQLLVDLTYCVHDDFLYCERHYAEQLKPRCAACDELIFSGEYTKAMSKDWHSGHFCCWQCDESLTGQRYVLRDDHPYCIKCYESVFANTCDECNKTIGIDSKDLSYKDKHWHEACFFCNKCRVSLVDKQFGSKADKIYCGNCYDAQFASRCDGCGQIFRAGTKKMEYKTRQWHEQCFCCCVCKSAIGTKSFIPREQEIYCATCYEEKFATRCVKCNKIITSGGVTYKNEPWHRECFTCTNCNTSLAGQRFTSRDEKPYCADCFGELFAKRCTSCCKPITGIGGTRFISFEDRHWHNDCFICAACKTSLVGRGFITDAEDILCTECAKQKLM